MSTKPPPDSTRHGSVRLSWIREQLRIAGEIMDNPGGGLVFGYQAMGQARAHLEESGDPAYDEVIGLLTEAEREAVYRNFGRARELLARAGEKLPD